MYILYRLEKPYPSQSVPAVKLPTPISHIHLLSIPHSCNLRMSHLLLQLENPVHQRLTGRRAPWHINIHWDNSITPPSNTIAIMIITTPIRTTAHTNHPSRVRHLIIDLTECWGHFIGEGAGYNHDVGLTRGSTENYTEAILVVTGCTEVHHFDGAAGEAKCHGPERTLTCPVGNLVESCQSILHNPLLPLLAWQQDLPSLLPRNTQLSSNIMRLDCCSRFA